MRNDRVFGRTPEAVLAFVVLLPAVAFLSEVVFGALSQWDIAGSGGSPFPTLASFAAALRSEHWYFLVQQVSRAAIVALIDIVIAVPAAHVLVRKAHGKRRLMLLVLLLLPFFMNSATKAFSWTVLLGAHGPIGALLRLLQVSDDMQHGLSHGLFATLISLVSSSLPLAFLAIVASMAAIPDSVWGLCEDMGVETGSELMNVALPNSRAGIVSGWIASFVVSALASSEIDFSSTDKGASLTRVVQGLFNERNPNAAMAMGVLLMLSSIFIVLIFVRTSDLSGRFHSERRIGGGRLWRLLEILSLATLVFVILVPALGVVVQACFILSESSEIRDRGFSDLLNDESIALALQNSLLVAVLVSVVSVAASTVVALLWWDRRFFQKVMILSLCLAAIPGETYSMGVYFCASHLGLHQSTLFLMGFSQLPWVFAFVLMTVASGYMKVDRTVIEAAQDLGASGRDIFVRFILRDSWPEVCLAALVGLVLSVNDASRASMISGGNEVISEYVSGRLISGRTAADFLLASGGVAVGLLVVLSFLACVLYVDSKSERTWSRAAGELAGGDHSVTTITDTI